MQNTGVRSQEGSAIVRKSKVKSIKPHERLKDSIGDPSMSIAQNQYLLLS